MSPGGCTSTCGGALDELDGLDDAPLRGPAGAEVCWAVLGSGVPGEDVTGLDEPHAAAVVATPTVSTSGVSIRAKARRMRVRSLVS